MKRFQSWLDSLLASKEVPEHRSGQEGVQPLDCRESDAQVATDSPLKQKVQQTLRVYHAALDYLNSLDHLDEDSYEKLDQMLEPVGAAMGPQKRRKMIEASLHILPDPDRGDASGTESLRSMLKENLEQAIITFGKLADSLSDLSETPPKGAIVQEAEPRPQQIRALARGQFVCRAKLQPVTEDPGKSTPSLIVVDDEGRLSAELARASAGERLSTFAVSPDGHWVAFTCYVQRPEGYEPFPEIRAVSADGRQSCPLTRWDARFQPCYLNPVFSPRSGRLVCEFALKHPYNPNLMVLRLDEIGDSLYGGRETEIINPLRIGNHAPQFLPDGERIVYFGNFAYEDLLEVCLYDPHRARAEMLGYVGERLTEKGDGVWRRQKAIAVQPEWEQVFFIRGHTLPNEQICVFTLSDIPPGAVLKQFTAVGGEYNHIGSLQISPDGQWLAFDADDSIYVMAADGSSLKRLSPGQMSCRGPAFSPDGARLAFISQGKVYTISLRGEELTQLTGDELTVEEFVWV